MLSMMIKLAFETTLIFITYLHMKIDSKTKKKVFRIKSFKFSKKTTKIDEIFTVDLTITK